MELERKKKEKVVALKYDVLKQGAPRVVAKGQGSLAERMLEVAREHGIPLKHDPELVEILSQLEVGKDIPAELYQAVAEVMIFIYKMNQRKLDKFERDNAAAQAAENAARRPA
jgi:flagellar biosynthesis protein